MTRRSIAAAALFLGLGASACSSAVEVGAPQSGAGQGGATSTGAHTATSTGGASSTGTHTATSSGAQGGASSTTNTVTSSGAQGGASNNSSTSAVSDAAVATSASAGTGGAGAGGGGQCDPNNANGYEADFDIQLAAGVAPEAFCINCGAVVVTFALPDGATGHPGVPGACGSTPCDRCTTLLCPGSTPPPPCLAMPFPASGTQFRWNGNYFTDGACSVCDTPGCGPALACQNFACASPGHYSATFCATRAASVTGSECTADTTQACTTVEFDLPSATAIPVLIGP